MRKRTPLFFAPLFLALLPSTSAAQDNAASPSLPATFTSDRPGFANTTGVAAVGRLTTELGVSAAFDDVAPEGSLPQLSLRVGVFEWLEARWRGPNGVGDFGPGGPRFGLSDPSVGFKLGGRLAENVTISSVWEVSMPLGTDDFGSPEAEFFADVNLAWGFWSPLSLTVNAVAMVLTSQDGAGETRRLFDGGGSIRFDWQIIDVFGVFVQSYVLKSEVSDWRVQVGGGLYWQVAPTVQLDAHFNTGVTAGDDEPPTAQLGTTVLW
ncbi:MAG: transporter [Sandaracinaceae bacterium]